MKITKDNLNKFVIKYTSVEEFLVAKNYLLTNFSLVDSFGTYWVGREKDLVRNYPFLGVYTNIHSGITAWRDNFDGRIVISVKDLVGNKFKIYQPKWKRVDWNY